MSPAQLRKYHHEEHEGHEVYKDGLCEHNRCHPLMFVKPHVLRVLRALRGEFLFLDITDA